MINYCNDGSICIHFRFIIGRRGNVDYFECGKYRIPIHGPHPKRCLDACVEKGNYISVKPVKTTEIWNNE